MAGYVPPYLMMSLDRTYGPQTCLMCQARIGVLQRLQSRKFCSGRHEAMYFDQINQMAAERLRQDAPAGESNTGLLLPKSAA